VAFESLMKPTPRQVRTRSSRCSTPRKSWPRPGNGACAERPARERRPRPQGRWRCCVGREDFWAPSHPRGIRSPNQSDFSGDRRSQPTTPGIPRVENSGVAGPLGLKQAKLGRRVSRQCFMTRQVVRRHVEDGSHRRSKRFRRFQLITRHFQTRAVDGRHRFTTAHRGTPMFPATTVGRPDALKMAPRSAVVVVFPFVPVIAADQRAIDLPGTTPDTPTPIPPTRGFPSPAPNPRERRGRRGSRSQGPRSGRENDGFRFQPLSLTGS
jgi:hypothetical protein